VKYGHDADHLVTISEVATGCADDISSKQPKGPYFLAGYSWGALVALETARILQDRGLEVRWIGLVDQEPPLALPRAIDSCLSFIRSRLSLAPVNYNWLLNKVIGTTLIAKEARLRGPVVLWERLQQRRRNYKAAPPAIGSSGPGTVRHGPNRRPSSDFDLVHAWRQRTFMIHAAPPTQADACLFLTDNLSRNFPAILQRWSRYARITQEMRLPGSHNSLWKDRSALESALAHALAVHPEFRDRLGNGSHQQGSHSENTRHCTLP
jgi:thioesterase domain-containing protein